MTPRKDTSAPSPDDHLKEAGAVSDRTSMPGDYSVFVWQKLNSLDDRLAKLCENFGRVETKLDALDHRAEKLEGKVSKLERTILYVGGGIAGAMAIIGLLWAVYKFASPHMTVTFH